MKVVLKFFKKNSTKKLENLSKIKEKCFKPDDK